MTDTLTERQAFMVMNDLPNIGPITLNRLLEEFGGDPCAILTADRRRLESVRGVGPETSAALLNWRTHFDLVREEDRLVKAGATFITARDAGYPKLLKEIHDPPIAHVPRLLAVVAGIVALAPWIGHQIGAFAERIFLLAAVR